MLPNTQYEFTNIVISLSRMQANFKRKYIEIDFTDALYKYCQKDFQTPLYYNV